MTVHRGLAVLAIVAGVAVVIASPARADDFSGTYLETGPGFQSTWLVTPCGPNCAHVADSSGWSADAHVTYGRWTFSVDRPDATKCLNGIFAPGTALYSVDVARLDGTVVTSNPAPCGLAAGYATPLYFVLAKTS
jgi:hypothetical protein